MQLHNSIQWLKFEVSKANKLKWQFTLEDNYKQNKIKHVNDKFYWGGRNARGDFILHFFSKGSMYFFSVHSSAKSIP